MTVSNSPASGFSSGRILNLILTSHLLDAFYSRYGFGLQEQLSAINSRIMSGIAVSKMMEHRFMSNKIPDPR
jgi:hypothetical protein